MASHRTKKFHAKKQDFYKHNLNKKAKKEKTGEVFLNA